MKSRLVALWKIPSSHRSPLLVIMYEHSADPTKSHPVAPWMATSIIECALHVISHLIRDLSALCAQWKPLCCSYIIWQSFLLDVHHSLSVIVITSSPNALTGGFPCKGLLSLQQTLLQVLHTNNLENAEHLFNEMLSLTTQPHTLEDQSHCFQLL